MPTTHPTRRRYLAPDRVTQCVLNPIVTGLVKVGVTVRGARELQVRGRRSGAWRMNPVNPLEHDGRTYLVAPRGHTEWVRNLRVAGEGRLRGGRRVEQFDAVELADVEKADVIRAYLRRWAFEVGKFLDGLTAESSDAELLAAAPGIPVFEIRRR